MSEHTWPQLTARVTGKRYAGAIVTIFERVYDPKYRFSRYKTSGLQFTTNLRWEILSKLDEIGATELQHVYNGMPAPAIPELLTELEKTLILLGTHTLLIDTSKNNTLLVLLRAPDQSLKILFNSVFFTRGWQQYNAVEQHYCNWLSDAQAMYGNYVQSTDHMPIGAKLIIGPYGYTVWHND